MFSPKSILIKNIGTHVSTYYEFEQSNSTLIFGINNDTEKPRSNGSGKSSFIEAIHIALTGKPIKNITKDKIIRNGEDSGEIAFVLENKVTQTEVLINWFLHRKKSWTCRVFINDIEKTDFTSVVDVPNWIMEQFDISKEDFKSYFLVSKTNYQSFFETSDTDKKSVIARFSNADSVDATQGILASKISNIESEISSSQNEISKQEGAIEQLEKQLEEINNFDDKKEISQLELLLKQEEELVDQNLSKTEDLNQLVDGLKNDLVSINEKENALKQERDSYSNQKRGLFDMKEKLEDNFLSDFNAKNKKDIDEASQIESETLELNRNIQSQIDQLNHDLSELNNILAGEIVCPKCSGRFFLGEDEDPQEIKKLIEEINYKITKKKTKIEQNKEVLAEIDFLLKKIEKDKIKEKELLNEKTKNIDDQIKGVNDKIKETENKITSVFNEKNSKESSLSQIQSKIKELDTEIKASRLSISSIESKIEKIKSGEAKKKKIEDINSKIKELNGLISSIKKTFEDKIKKIKEYKEWQISFKKFKSFLVNKTIKSINGYCNYYLELMKSDLRIIIEGYKTNKDGTIKESITTFVERNGEQEGEYAKLSGGERTTIDLALILSVQRMINNSSQTGGLDLLITDEIIESVDEVGVEDIIKSLDKIKQTSLHVTHSPINKNVDHKLIFEKTNKKTKIYAG